MRGRPFSGGEGAVLTQKKLKSEILNKKKCV